MELKDGELKNRKENTEIEIEELFCKLIIMPKDDMDKFQEQEMKKIRPIRKNGMIKQTVVRGKKPKIIRDKLKDKIIRDTWTLFETGEEKKRKKRRSIMKE